VLASAPAWAVRPSAASARFVASPALFLPAWSRMGDHRCSPSIQVRSQASSAVGVLGRASATSRLSRLAGRNQNQHCKGWPNFEYQMPEVSTRQPRASQLSSQSLSAVAVSRSGHPLAQPGSPNPSVKGTSRKRAAPYVER
jgi:hypothetical protein